MTQPEPRDWRSGLRRAGFDVGATNEDREACLARLDLNWWYIDATGHDILGRPGRIVFVELWEGKDVPRPEGTPWSGRSDRSLDEALGKALWRYFTDLANGGGIEAE